MFRLDEERVVDSILKSILGEDKTHPNGYKELDNPVIQGGIESIVYGRVRKDENLSLAGYHAICGVIERELKSCEDDDHFHMNDRYFGDYESI